MNGIKSISFIGAGNVATHLASALYAEGFEINQIFSPNSAQELANKTNAQAIIDYADLNNDCDLFIIAVKDDVLLSVVEDFPFKESLAVHTSGSIGIDVFAKNNFQDFGIFYPLQTFSKETKVDFLEIPFCIEANLSENLLVELAKTLSNTVELVNSEQRKKLHLAAVFACNFSNYMYHISETICKENQVNFNILKPLIKETAKKITVNSPKDVQTGPAIREDQKIIDSHLSQLNHKKEFQKLYLEISKQIRSIKKP